MTRPGAPVQRSWSGLVPWLMVVPFAFDAVWHAARGRLHWENVACLAAIVGLVLAGRRGKKLLFGLYPLGLVGVLYNAMDAVRDLGVTPERVHICDLRNDEMRLFGVHFDGRLGTVHDWFRAHPSFVLDVLCAVPYGTFLFVCVACAVWLYVRDYPRMLRFAWCWFALNVAGFVTYHLYPAAPPWYFHAYGCAVHMHAPASAGPSLARVDAWLGVDYFAGMYGRASDTFGAMPSLHVAYALMVVVLGWPVMSNAWRGLSAAYFLLMAFSAVYLDHHWILDALAGAAYCVVVVAAARLLAPLRRAAAPIAADAVDPGAVSSPRAVSLSASKAPTAADGAP